jgi:hypothetical protein
VQPVPETREVRRTVRVAVALVAGQLLLCTVIGWVTFSHPRERAHRDSAAVDQMVVPPIPIAPSPSPPAPSPTPAPTPTTAIPRKHSTHQVDRAPPATTAQPAVEAATGGPAAAAPATTSESPQVTLLPPAASVVPAPSPSASATPTEAVEEPVVAGAPCDRLGALGRTADGVDVRCLPDRQGRLRWKIV